MSKKLLDQNKIAEFKAGDFTSGKMSEIFKSCYMTIDTTVIKHKQFGKAVLAPEEHSCFMVTKALSGNLFFKEYLINKHNLSVDEFINFDDDVKFNIVNDFLLNGFSTWYDMMVGLLLAWGKDNE